MKIDDATPAQREAITTDAPDVLCVAGPGAGKTATVIARIQRLLNEGVPAEHIVVITFTNAAANELQRRLPKSPGSEDPVALGFVGTLHSFCLGLLRQYGAGFGYKDCVALISPDSAQDLMASKAKSLACKLPMKHLLTIKAAGKPERSPRMPVEHTVVCSYLDELKANSIVDYDVILSETCDMLTSRATEGLALEQSLGGKFSHLFVDEVQDSATLDWKIYEALPITNKFFVGDSDQSIFAFRGASVRQMLVHAATIPGCKVISLEENFRSRREICEVAQRLIERNATRIPKVTKSVSGLGGMVTVLEPAQNAGEEISLVSSWLRRLESVKDVAILARTNHIADGFRNALKAANVPIVQQTREGLPMDWRVARAYVELLVNPENDTLAFFLLAALYEHQGASQAKANERAHNERRAAQIRGISLNRAHLGIGAITKPENALKFMGAYGVSRESCLIAAERFHDLPHGATMLDFSLELAQVRDRVKEEEGDGIRCLTVHAAKGREFDHVFLAGFEDQDFPGRDGATEDGIEESRRLAYVAITRARKSVFLTSAAGRTTAWGEIVRRTPSRFLVEMFPELPK